MQDFDRGYYEDVKGIKEKKGGKKLGELGEPSLPRKEQSTRTGGTIQVPRQNERQGQLPLRTTYAQIARQDAAG